MKFNAKVIIVDADVARSSGTTDHPVSKNSRVVLQAILNSDMKVAFCPELLLEWKQHKSLFAKKWLATMVAKKKHVIISPPKSVNAEVACAKITDAEKHAAIKDAHVVNSAIFTDKFIASNDKIARGIYSVVSQGSKILHGLYWAAPSEVGEEMASLLKEGGFIPDEWKLSHTI